MAGLAEQSLQQSAGARWLRRIGLAAGMAAVVALVIWIGSSLSHGPAEPQRQVARISILPDTPPPPPPPPPPEQRQPQEQPKQQIDPPKQQTPPAPQQLKMEGQAGEGPSPFAAGEVKHEYIGGQIGDGSRYSAYIGRLEQRVQSALSRRKLHLTDVKLFVWLAPDGSIQRYTVRGGDDSTQRDVGAALMDTNQGAEAPLAGMPMPVGLQIN